MTVALGSPLTDGSPVTEGVDPVCGPMIGPVEEPVGAPVGAVIGAFERRRGFPLRRQARVLAPLLVVWAVGFGVLGAVAVRGRVGDLLLDPTYASGGAWYLGAVSQLGVLAWTLGVGAACGAAWVARRTGRPAAARFLGGGAGAGAVLLIDDLFGLHSNIIPMLGLPKRASEAAVAAPVALWIVTFRRDLARTRWQVLACSLAGLAVSVLVDSVVHPGQVDVALLAEDGPKFLGALAWATYFVLTARDVAASAIDAGRSGAPGGVGRRSAAGG